MAKVIFLQNIRNVAQIGDIKEVADGYARNFLLPRKLAVLATDNTLKIAGQLKEKRVLEAQKEESMVAGLIEKLANYTLNIERAANEDGTLYDGLDSAEISGYLKKGHFFIEPEQVILEAPLKKTGAHEVEVEFGKNKKATLKIEIKKLAE
ncbi:MAG: 50S ribosomal protein L9 [bacterium]|nr:50S ribosomal protein L9 [bacterium]